MGLTFSDCSPEINPSFASRFLLEKHIGGINGLSFIKNDLKSVLVSKHNSYPYETHIIHLLIFILP